VVDISIPYDQSPQNYAKKLYVKARKLKRSINILNVLIEKVRHIRYLYTFHLFFKIKFNG
jgi:hypothetical protein